MEEGTERSGTLSLNARRFRGRPGDKTLCEIALIRTSTQRMLPGGGYCSGYEGCGSEAAFKEACEEIKRSMRRNAIEARPARDSGETQKGVRADCYLFDRLKGCKFRPTPPSTPPSPRGGTQSLPPAAFNRRPGARPQVIDAKYVTSIFRRPFQ